MQIVAKSMQAEILVNIAVLDRYFKILAKSLCQPQAFFSPCVPLIVGQNRRSENRRLPEWPIAKTADESLGPPEINLPIPLIQ